MRAIADPCNFLLDLDSVKSLERGELGTSIEALFDFETDIAWCQGHFRLLELGRGSSNWAAWIVFTALKDLKGHAEKVGNLRPNIVDRRPKRHPARAARK